MLHSSPGWSLLEPKLLEPNAACFPAMQIANCHLPVCLSACPLVCLSASLLVCLSACFTTALTTMGWGYIKMLEALPIITMGQLWYDQIPVVYTYLLYTFPNGLLLRQGSRSCVQLNLPCGTRRSIMAFGRFPHILGIVLDNAYLEGSHNSRWNARNGWNVARDKWHLRNPMANRWKLVMAQKLTFSQFLRFDRVAWLRFQRHKRQWAPTCSIAHRWLRISQSSFQSKSESGHRVERILCVTCEVEGK